MLNAFNAQSKNIAELLGDAQPIRLIVPKFQRGYSWEKKHVSAFWNDIWNFHESRGTKGGPDKYFLGPIVIMGGRTSKDPISLLDGQQRLATATILLSVIRDVARALQIAAAESFADDIQNHLIHKEDVGFSIERGELDKMYFCETIQMEHGGSRKATLRSHRNIQKARTDLFAAVSGKISTLNPTEALSALKRLRAAIRSDIVMACIPVESERDAFLIFETLNDRGLRLSVPDLLLNFLMRVADSDDARGKIRSLWNDMLTSLGRRDINRFLRHMWVSKYGDLKNHDLFSALKFLIEKEKLDSLTFAQDCATECVRYVELLDSKPEHLGDAARYIGTLIKQLDCQPALPLLLSARGFFDLPSLESLARLLTVFVTRYSILARLDSSGLETVLFTLAREIREMGVPSNEDEKQKPRKGQSPKACVSYVKSALIKNAPDDKQVQASLQTLVFDPEEAAYVLNRLATRMQTDTKELALDETNLEHVFPKNPAPSLEKCGDA